ncbi:substrate-binding periplasmic protein [Roseateles oligotrophus]|uniref:Transporter substrate-binding domain-containing protein n=1 Tax=Roseateles oligotrophus TaxID=1769250 RepID=A0ABT2Y8T0_9BURK|nr:transporter substrate-binding domain-containing protein [Roseateles oligotrophus]MCV2366495.1 transporter substrate-binding domain-containing protein [Roseateles oligotrophus]
MRIAVGSCLLALCLTRPAMGQHLTLLTEEYPPYNMSGAKGQVSGISTQIVKALLTEAGLEYEVTLYPWARAISMARVQINTCVYSMSRTPEREALYKWIGPLVYNDWALFALSDAARPNRLDELLNASIGSYQGDAIVSYLQTRGHRVDVASSDDLNPKKLQLGRIDYWATGRLTGQYRLQQQGIQGIAPVLNFNRTEMYLACNAQMPDDLVKRLNALLTGLDKQGAIKKIYADFGYSP